jgi:hypothetical protein
MNLLHQIANSFATIPGAVVRCNERALTPEDLARIRRENPDVRPSLVVDCWCCEGIGSTDVGETSRRCLICNGRGHIATEGGEA